MDTPEQTFAPQTKPLIEPIDTNRAQLILIRGLLNSATLSTAYKPHYTNIACLMIYYVRVS